MGMIPYIPLGRGLFDLRRDREQTAPAEPIANLQPETKGRARKEGIGRRKLICNTPSTSPGASPAYETASDVSPPCGVHSAEHACEHRDGHCGAPKQVCRNQNAIVPRCGSAAGGEDGHHRTRSRRVLPGVETTILVKCGRKAGWTILEDCRHGRTELQGGSIDGPAVLIWVGPT